MPYDPSLHVLNNPMTPPKLPADDHYFGPNDMIPLTGIANLAATPHGTVTVPPTFTGTIAEVQALVDAITDLIDADRTAFNELVSTLRKN